MEDIKYQLYWFKLCVFDSYSVKPKDFDSVLDKIQSEIPGCKLWTERTRRSLKCEWLAHNICYKLGIQKDKTKDVDFEFRQDKKLNTFYEIIGHIIYPFD